MSKRTIIIDTDNDIVSLLQEGYNIIEQSWYDDDGDIVQQASKLLNDMLCDDKETSSIDGYGGLTIR